MGVIYCWKGWSMHFKVLAKHRSEINLNKSDLKNRTDQKTHPIADTSTKSTKHDLERWTLTCGTELGCWLVRHQQPLIRPLELRSWVHQNCWANNSSFLGSSCLVERTCERTDVWHSCDLISLRDCHWSQACYLWWLLWSLQVWSSHNWHQVRVACCCLPVSSPRCWNQDSLWNRPSTTNHDRTLGEKRVRPGRLEQVRLRTLWLVVDD